MSLTLSRDRVEAATPGSDTTLKRLMLVVEYDGTSYAGSQRQANEPTIQACLEESLSKLTGSEITVSLAGRTDAGVHARGQVASFTTSSELPLRAFVHGLNYHLPGNIAVKTARIVAEGFDPRRQALCREYEYYILNQDTRSPLWQNRAFHLPGKLDINAMSEAASLLLGEHDFASFACGMDDGKSTVRNVFQANFRREEELVIFTISGSAFLPHQVRGSVGTLIRVGQGKLSIAHFKNIMEACQPGLAGPMVPACGLYLNKVIYNNNEE